MIFSNSKGMKMRYYSKSVGSKTFFINTYQSKYEAYFTKIIEIEDIYLQLTDWLINNAKGKYELTLISSDFNEGHGTGFYISFVDEEDAVQFKLVWL